MKLRIYILSTLALLLHVFAAPAAVHLPALLSDHMVLQQQSEITLWGWADPGEQVQVQPSWQKKTLQATAGNDGGWSVVVKTPKAGSKEHSLIFTASNTIRVAHILFGEVWLASGQSNMEFFMGKGAGWRTGVLDYEQEIARAHHPLIRMIDVPNTVADTPRSDFEGRWQVCSPATAADFSAVAYYFALSVQEKTGYPIGIINATWGGTPAQSWTKRSVLEADSEFRPILDRYAQVCAEYPENLAAYKTKLETWKADTSSTKKGAPKEPIGPKHNKSPSKLYNGMITPLLPYKLKGVIWYQGESNAEYAWQYRKLFPAMIAGWRADWQDQDLPFYFVQIAPHKGQNPVIREAQLYAYQTTPHTGIVVTTDVGDARDIHPRNKKTVGARLALWALHNEYGAEKLETSGPLYRAMSVSGNRVVLDFDHATGLKAVEGPLKEFSVAGADRQFVPAQAVIKGDKIEVWSDAVAQPVAVRFAWQYVPEPNLFNAAGLPASPFRTDSWPVETQDKR